MLLEFSNQNKIPPSQEAGERTKRERSPAARKELMGRSTFAPRNEKKVGRERIRLCSHMTALNTGCTCIPKTQKLLKWT